MRCHKLKEVRTEYNHINYISLPKKPLKHKSFERTMKHYSPYPAKKQAVNLKHCSVERITLDLFYKLS